jgi:hypothetical protein
MRTYRRVQSLPISTGSPNNKGVLVKIITTTTAVTFTCLDPTGNDVSVALSLGVGNNIIPFYVKSWTSASPANVTVWALN